MLITILAQLIATLALFPLLSFVFVYALTYIGTKSKRLALEWAINISTILLLTSIIITIKQLWGYSLIWLFVIIILLIAAGLTYLQYSIHGQIIYFRLTRGIIRLSFLLFVPIHIILYVWVIIRAIFLASL